MYLLLCAVPAISSLLVTRPITRSLNSCTCNIGTGPNTYSTEYNIVPCTAPALHIVGIILSTGYEPTVPWTRRRGPPPITPTRISPPSNGPQSRSHGARRLVALCQHGFADVHNRPRDHGHGFLRRILERYGFILATDGNTRASTTPIEVSGASASSSITRRRISTITRHRPF